MQAPCHLDLLVAQRTMAAPGVTGERQSPEPHSPGEGTALTQATLIHERSRPDFRALYGRLARRAVRLDAAVARIRLGGLDLGEPELGGLERIRVLVGRMNALSLASEADAMAADPERAPRLRLLASLLAGGRLEVRIAPLAGWNPDFSCFRGPGPAGDGTDGGGGGLARAVLIGPHWFQRPYPHPGPALGVLLEGSPARTVQARFEAIWREGHDLGRPVQLVLGDALRRIRGTRTRGALVG